MTTRRPPSTSAAPFSLTGDRGAPERADAAPQPQQFGTYRLLEALPSPRPSRERWLARRPPQEDGDPGRLCVVERLVSRDRDETFAFIDGANITVALNHLSILGCFDVGKVGEQFYQTFPHVPGPTLHELLARLAQERAPFPLEAAAFVLRELIAALSYAHTRLHPITHHPLDIVHGTLDAHSIIVDLDGDVLVTGFGDAHSKLRKVPRPPDPPSKQLPPDAAAPTTSLDAFLVARLALQMFDASADVDDAVVAPHRAALRAAPGQRPSVDALRMQRPAEAGPRLLRELIRRWMPELHEREMARTARANQ